jgi:radical SAM superfamily enzyme YgiQ (UPF0313 family)
MKVTLVDPNVGYSPTLNIALAYIISSIEEKHSTRLIDLTFQWKNYIRYFENNLLKEKPDILGFCVNSFNFSIGLKLASLAKKIYPDIHIVFGGVHPTICPDEVIQQPFIDSICIGEGESSFPEFLDKLEKEQEPRVDGFWFKDKTGGIVRNQLRPFEPNLDTLPFPNWDYWDIEKYLYNNHVYTGPGGLIHLTSRGCPYNCNFCSAPLIRKSVPGNYYRVRSAENVIEEINKNIKKYWHLGFKGLDIHDGYFGANWQQFEKFCNLYKKEGLNRVMPWACMTRPDVVTERWAQLAASAGCEKVNMGIETANEFLRNEFYRKQTSDKQIEQAIANLEKYGIHYLFLMIAGCPAESRETIKQSIDFIKRYSPIEVRMHFCQPHPKTDCARIVGTVIDDTDKEFAFLKGDDVCRMRTKYLSIKELNMLIFSFRVWWVLRWIKYDLSNFGFRFIADIIKYVFNIGGIRHIPLRHPHTYKVIKARTHLKYNFDLSKKRHGIKADNYNKKLLSERS